MSTNDTSARAATRAMADGRRADSDRRRQRVLTALATATRNGEQISVSGIARAAGVDRTFLYRHRELLEQVHAADAQPPGAPGAGPALSRASLQADLLAAQQRCRPPVRPHPATRDPPVRPARRASLVRVRPRRPLRHRQAQTTNQHARTAHRRPAPATPNATKTSRPHAPRTANSWPKSTPQNPTDKRGESYLHHTCCTR